MGKKASQCISKLAELMMMMIDDDDFRITVSKGNPVILVQYITYGKLFIAKQLTPTYRQVLYFFP